MKAKLAVVNELASSTEKGLVGFTDSLTLICLFHPFNISRVIV